MSPLLRKFQQDILSILWCAIGLFLALALATYNPKDPSLNSFGNGFSATNACGPMGSLLADFLYQLLGLCAWILPISFVKLSWNTFQGETKSLTRTRWLWAALLMVCASSLISVYWPHQKIYANQIFLGGLLGTGVSQVLLKAFNSTGLMGFTK